MSSSVYGGKKERKRESIDGIPVGDNLKYSNNNGVKTIIGIAADEIILFSDAVFKYDRYMTPFNRDIVVFAI